MIPMESGPGFIPTICTQSTAVPVAFDRNSAKVSSAIASRLWVVRVPLRTRGCWVLLLVVLTTCNHRLTARVCNDESHIMELLPHVPVLVNEAGHLLLQPVILLHQQLVHRSQLPVHSLQARCLLALLLAAPAVLEPDLDLLGLDVAEYGALADELLAAERAGLGALAVDPLQRLHLLRGVAHVLARVHLRRPSAARRRPVLPPHSMHRRHHRRRHPRRPFSFFSRLRRRATTTTRATTTADRAQ
ncbi:Os03g0640825 [Oryza sativa Japonica Group]|uniref:Os03g0640825 protein n=1 Tax=Oryza sativa subsp. japonica TaxID=39947 RepID=A0A0P0W181_ORYSJ|nr:hypothetical protein EE612_019166 [Oryza sativa]BAS85430.1 Os03g0640825 [Oryza sativa Japonica Group]